MCGRFKIERPDDCFDEIGIPPPADLFPRYNVAPTQPVVAVRAGPAQALEARWMRWGWIPRWAADGKGPPLINARAETAAQKPTFKQALGVRRCLVPADGFYEWKHEGKARYPFLFRRREGRPFAIAALWDPLADPGAGPAEAVLLLTTRPNRLVAQVHDRMPVILPRATWARWLDPAPAEPGTFADLLVDYPAADMEAFAVSPRVGSAKVDEPGLVEPQGELTVPDA